MPTVKPARALRECWDAGGAGNAAYAMAGRGGSKDNKGQRRRYHGSGSSANDASDVRKAATTVDATSDGAEASRAAAREHREPADVRPHSQWRIDDCCLREIKTQAQRRAPLGGLWVGFGSSPAKLFLALPPSSPHPLPAFFLAALVDDSDEKHIEWSPLTCTS